jgi:RNA polymerase sigma-70 factor (ECF subfamily)
LEPYPDDLLFSDWNNPEEQASTRENISLAFIAALHLLPPRQRAVLILRDVLDWQASEVAALLDTSIAAVKSSLHRARVTLAEHRYRPEDDRALDAERQALLDDYLRAWETADIELLVKLLNDDATFSMPPIPSWYRGRETIRGLVSKTVFGGQAQGRWRLLSTAANRQPAFGLYRQVEDHGQYAAYGIQVLTFRHGLIADITTFRNPALFPYFGLPPTLDMAPIRA